MLVGLLDCHYENQRRPWEWGWLEIVLGRQFNADLVDRLTAQEIPCRWWSSDKAHPKSVRESHQYKADCVLSHEPTPDLVIEMHFNHAPPGWHGFLTEGWRHDQRSMKAASLIAAKMYHGLGVNVHVVRHPDERYVVSGLFRLLEPRVPFVLIEAGNLDDPHLRAEYQNRDEDSRWWTVVHAIERAIVEMAEGEKTNEQNQV